MLRYQLSTTRMDAPSEYQALVERHLAHMESQLKHVDPELVHAVVELSRHSRREEYRAVLRLFVLDSALVSRRSAESVEGALLAAAQGVERQLQRYMGRLRGEHRYERTRAGLAPAARAADERVLIEERELLDRALAGDRAAFDRLTWDELPAVSAVIRKELERAGAAGSGVERIGERVLTRTLATCFEALARRPANMSLQGWLADTARRLTREEAGLAGTKEGA